MIVLFCVILYCIAIYFGSMVDRIPAAILPMGFFAVLATGILMAM